MSKWQHSFYSILYFDNFVFHSKEAVFLCQNGNLDISSFDIVINIINHKKKQQFPGEKTMIIADLQHLEDVTLESNTIEGSGSWWHFNVNKALAGSTATAIGDNSFTKTFTDTKVVLGGGSSSTSLSVSKVWG